MKRHERSESISYSFEPGRPQRIISGLKINFSLSQNYSACKSLNHTGLFHIHENISAKTSHTKTKTTHLTSIRTHLTSIRTHQSLLEKMLQSQNFEIKKHLEEKSPFSFDDTAFRVYLYSAGTQHGNLHQLPVTTSSVTCFILRVHTGN